MTTLQGKVEYMLYVMLSDTKHYFRGKVHLLLIVFVQMMQTWASKKQFKSSFLDYVNSKKCSPSTLIITSVSTNKEFISVIKNDSFDNYFCFFFYWSRRSSTLQKHLRHLPLRKTWTKIFVVHHMHWTWHLLNLLSNIPLIVCFLWH